MGRLIDRLVHGRLVPAAMLAMLAALVFGCSLAPSPSLPPGADEPGEWAGGTTEQAEVIVRHWLAAAAGAESDRGWSLLYPLTRSERYRGDEAAYRNALAAGDWSAFGYDVRKVTLDDGEYRVELRVRNAPPVLEELGLLQYEVTDGVGPVRASDGHAVDGRGLVVVRIGSDAEGEGIQAL